LKSLRKDEEEDEKIILGGLVSRKNLRENKGEKKRRGEGTSEKGTVQWKIFILKILLKSVHILSKKNPSR